MALGEIEKVDQPSFVWREEPGVTSVRRRVERKAVLSFFESKGRGLV